jgi:protein phosphatase 1L
MFLYSSLAIICGCSEDGSMHCGYSSYRGRRDYMEDFYDIKSSNKDAKRINVFGVFDGKEVRRFKHVIILLYCSDYNSFVITGHGGSCAAKYLKEHLFVNLLKHPAFITDTKLAISMIFTHRALL